jgi:hypothetical protein
MNVGKCFQCNNEINPADPGNSKGAKLRGSQGDIDVEFHTRCWYEFDHDREHKPDSRAAQYQVLLHEFDVSQH